MEIGRRACTVDLMARRIRTDLNVMATPALLSGFVPGAGSRQRSGAALRSRGNCLCARSCHCSGGKAKEVRRSHQSSLSRVRGLGVGLDSLGRSRVTVRKPTRGNCLRERGDPDGGGCNGQRRKCGSNSFPPHTALGKKVGARGAKQTRGAREGGGDVA